MFRFCGRGLGRLTTSIACLGLLICGVAAAQTAPTPEQMEVFRSLTPEQQRAVLERSGRTADGVRDPSLQVPATVAPTDAKGSPVSAIAPEEPRIRGGDTVVITASVKPPAEGSPRPSATSIESATRFVERLNRGNPYKLDSLGTLVLSGVAPIALAGLTEGDANLRLNSDPALKRFDVKVQLLPLEKRDEEALKPFGYDLFAGAPTTFAPVTDVPVPAEYVVGPGDRIEVQLIGKTRARHSLVVNRDGSVNFPDLGPIPVSGLRFEAARTRIESRVEQEMIGTKAVVSMGDLRTIRIFVLGEAERPGSYTVSGLATIANALFVSGGVKKIGSLRDIQVKRGGAVVARLDLYDLLLRGDTSDDVRLQPGDVIFIPPVGKTVGVVGKIRRPAIYELKHDETAADLLHFGGGLAPSADPRLARLERIDERRERVVVDLDLTKPQARSSRLRDGDLLRIPAIRTTFENAVSLIGHVQRPGEFQFRPGVRLTDVLPSVSELKMNADQHYVLIRREDAASRRIRVLSADLQAAWRAPRSAADLELAPRDTVVVFDTEAGRGQYLAPILEQLRHQASAAEPAPVVQVGGEVPAPGEYPLEPGMKVADLIRAGGGLTESAFQGSAELARYVVKDGETRTTDVRTVNVQQALAGDASANLLLAPADFLVIKEISEWSRRETVRLEGEVRFPGEYPIERGETLQQVIARAGGLTPLAFPQGSVFTRETSRVREQEQLRLLADNLQQDLSMLALQAAQAAGTQGGSPSETMAVGQTLLAELRKAQAVGRLVIDLPQVLAAPKGSPEDLMLRDGDRLIVPRRVQEVSIIGEVQNSTSVMFKPSLSRDDYIRQSGGLTRRADASKIYVVRADGSVATGSGNAWFGKREDIRPGDTIVVPLDAERIRPLPLWTAVTTIMYNIAVAVAAINSF